VSGRFLFQAADLTQNVKRNQFDGQKKKKKKERKEHITSKLYIKFEKKEKVLSRKEGGPHKDKVMAKLMSRKKENDVSKGELK
jgi:recombinational DNA repair ATPase RecF